jgi:hypothetical protein
MSAAVTAGRFTEEGTITYQRDLVGFTFRYLIQAAGPSGESDAATAALGPEPRRRG